MKLAGSLFYVTRKEKRRISIYFISSYNTSSESISEVIQCAMEHYCYHFTHPLLSVVLASEQRQYNLHRSFFFTFKQYIISAASSQQNEKCKEASAECGLCSYMMIEYEKNIIQKKHTYSLLIAPLLAHKFESNGSSSFSGRLLIISIFIEHIFLLSVAGMCAEESRQ